jgi:hypothetical protein
MALSVLKTVICASEANEKIVKVMDDIQDFLSKIYKQSLKERSTDSYFKKQLPDIKFLISEMFAGSIHFLSVSNFFNPFHSIINIHITSLHQYFNSTPQASRQWWWRGDNSKLRNSKLEFLALSTSN